MVEGEGWIREKVDKERRRRKVKWVVD